jgi:uncharacterized hydrophobic protein (TIGR00271 family)
MPAIAQSDIARMQAELLFDGAHRGAKRSRFWALLTLAAIIATAGIVSDSTATVIGAMIVAPLMTPILGTVFSVVSADSKNLWRCVLLVVGGAAAVVLIAWLIGFAVPVPVDAATNSQVASRIHPRLMDLVAALATGAVGSFALVRSDVSDTLPGVAIAISLVPPLAVVGLTLESDRPHQAIGALLLFGTNVAAILLSGVIVMALYRVGALAAAGRMPTTGTRALTIAIVAGVLVLAVPLAAESQRINTEERNQSDVSSVAHEWAAAHHWEIVGIDSGENGVRVRAIGPPPIPGPQSFRAALDAHGLRSLGVRLELSPIERTDLPGS